LKFFKQLAEKYTGGAMVIKAAGNHKGKHLYRFKFWGRQNIILPQKEMVASRGGQSLVVLNQAQLLFDKDSLRVRAAFIPRKEIPGDLYAALELDIKSRKIWGSVHLGPFQTERVSGGIKLDDEVDIQRFLFNPSKWIYPLRALKEITLLLGDYGRLKDLDVFSPLCAATFNKVNKGWS
jgi:hypothetical protein